MRIQNNIPALNTFRQLGTNVTGTAKSLEKLSSGFRINRAGDDAAGLAISEKMRAQVRGLNRASQNAQDGISLIQAAEGALQEVHNILQRMRELSIQAANDVNQTIDRQAIQDEINQLVREIDRISVTTEFNKMTILDGSLANGMYIRNATGFNVSSLNINPQYNDDGNPTIVPSLTSIAVTEAGVNYTMTYDFALSATADAETGISAGLTNANVSGTIISITMSADVMTSAGIDPEIESNSLLLVAVNEGENGAVIAGNVRDTLAIALGSDWNVTATGTLVTVAHKFVGRFEEAFTLEVEAGDTGGGGEIFHTEGEWSIDDGTAIGTEGRDVTIAIDGGDSETVFAEGMNFMYLEADDAPEGLDGGEATIQLRGRDSIALLRVEREGDEGLDIAFSFRVDDASRLSGAIVNVALGRELALQIGANTGYDQTMRLNIGSLSATSLGVGVLNVLDHVNAQNAIASIDGALQRVSDQRALFGATQNRLEHTIANLDTVAENLQDAESRIRDADMAKEMMAFTKYTILTQASQAMLAQANNLPQGVLQLLR